MTDALPSHIGRYRVVRKIAEGGMGQVLLARHEGPAGFAKWVVVKRLLPHLAEDTRIVQGFLREARLAALLSHPNVVQIFDLGSENGEYFISMEYIAGKSLRAIHLAHMKSRAKKLPPPVVAFLVAQALHGLQSAHELRDDAGKPLQLVHRDISPDNVLVSFAGIVKVVDFGIAKAADDSALTQAGIVKGKISYVSPEQLRLERIDGRADLFAMGVVLYELLTGRRPFEGENRMAVMTAVLDGARVPVRVHNPEVPMALERIVDRALESDPAKRFESAHEMAETLEEWLAKSGERVGPEDVTKLLGALFGDEAKNALPEGIDAGSAVHPDSAPTLKPAAPAPTTAPLSGPVVIEDSAAPTLVTGIDAAKVIVSPRAFTEASPSSQVTRAGEPRWRSVPRAVWIAAAAVIVIGIGAVIATSAMREDTPRPRPVSVATAATPVAAPELRRQSAPDVHAAQGPIAAPLSKAVSGTSAPTTGSALAAANGPALPRSAAEVLQVSGAASPGTVAAVPSTVASPRSTNGESDSSRAASVPSTGARISTAVARPPPHTEPLPRQRGTVVFRVAPWAEVFLDGKSLGVTPIDPKQVPAGRRQFVLVNSELQVKRSVWVEVPAGGEVVLRADLIQSSTK